MKKASQIMYTIGKVFNIIGIVLSSIFVLIGIIITASGELVGGVLDLAEVEGVAEEAIPMMVVIVGVFYLIFGLIMLGLNIAAIVVTGKARASIEGGSMDTKPHVLTIVFGALTNTFYLLAGIFGLVARNKELKEQGNGGGIS